MELTTFPSACLVRCCCSEGDGSLGSSVPAGANVGVGGVAADVGVATDDNPGGALVLFFQMGSFLPGTVSSPENSSASFTRLRWAGVRPPPALDCCCCRAFLSWKKKKTREVITVADTRSCIHSVTALVLSITRFYLTDWGFTPQGLEPQPSL